MTTEETKQKKNKHRSPNYPFISLKEACDKAKVVWDKEGKHSVNPNVVIKHWEYGAKSSGGRLAISALLKYGLFEEVESDKGREVKLSDRAMIVIVGENEARKNTLKQLALEPKIYKELWEKFGSDLPSEDSLKSKLILEWKFNQAVVQKFIKDYKETISFAGLKEGDKIGEKQINEENEDKNQENLENGIIPPNIPPKNVQQIEKKMLATYHIPLGKNQATLSFYGEKLLPEDFSDLEIYVRLFKKQLSRTQSSNTLERLFPLNATWKNKGHEKPIILIEDMGAKDGVEYYKSQDGNEIPENELIFE